MYNMAQFKIALLRKKITVTGFAYTVEEHLSGSPNNVIIEGRFGIVVPKATTTISNFLTMCAVVDGS
jgi:hypothetical protein